MPSFNGIDPVEHVYVDEAGFNLDKSHDRVNTIIRQRAHDKIDCPCPKRGNAAISLHVVIYHHVITGSYTTAALLEFLNALDVRLYYLCCYHIWDNVSFHHAHDV